MTKRKRSLGCVSGVYLAMLGALMVLGVMESTSAAGVEVNFVPTTVRGTSFGARVHDVEFRRSAFNHVGWGSMAGIELPVGRNGWLIQANLRVIDTDISDSGGAFAIDRKRDIRVFSIGFGFRF